MSLPNKENLLQYYGEPVFEDELSLKIPVKGKVSGNNIVPPGSTKIYVLLSNAMCYKDASADTLIPMYEDYDFTYVTNEITDDAPPAFVQGGAPVLKVVSGSDESAWKDALSSPSFTTSDVADSNAREKKLKINARVKDDGTGITRIEYSVSMMSGSASDLGNREIYPKNKDFSDKTYSLKTYPSARTDEVSLSDIIDLSNAKLEEGFYKLTLNVVDFCDNSLTKDFYFVYDAVAPKTTNVKSKAVDGRVYLQCSSSSLDVNKIEIKNGSTGIGTMTGNKIDMSGKLSHSEHYDLCIVAQDYAGNNPDVAYGGTYYGDFSADRLGSLIGFVPDGEFKQGDAIKEDSIHDDKGHILIDNRKTVLEYAEEIVVIPTGCVARIDGNTPKGTSSKMDPAFEEEQNQKQIFSEGRKVQLGPYAMCQWEFNSKVLKVLDSNNGNYNPAESAFRNWHQAVILCNKLSIRAGLETVYYNETPGDCDNNSDNLACYAKCDLTRNGFRLPTEAEWKFAARGGDPAAADWNHTYSGSNKWSDVMIYSEKENYRPQNAFYSRLYIANMTGRHFEWCTDYEYIPGKPAEGYLVNPVVDECQNEDRRDWRIHRGGSYYHQDYNEVYYRGSAVYNVDWQDIGFRFCRTLPAE